MKVKSESDVTQSCPILSDAMDCSPPGSSVHGIFQARVLEWVAIKSLDLFNCLNMLKPLTRENKIRVIFLKVIELKHLVANELGCSAI